MKHVTGLRLIKTHSKNQAKESYLFFGSKLQFFKVASAISIIALLALFLPFAKSAMLALIFSCAIVGAEDRVKSLSKGKKIVLFSSLGIAPIIFVSVSSSLAKMIFTALSSMSDPAVLARLKIKMSELFWPTLHFVKEQLAKVWNQMGNAGSLDSKITNSANQAFDAIFNFLFQGLTQIPNNTLQIFFFLFLLVFLIRKISTVEHSGLSFLSANNNASLKVLISVGKQSAYNSVGTTIVTALAQASVLTIGSAFIGIAVWPIVFVASFISSMVPIVGILPVAIACTVYAASEFDAKRAIIIAAFGLAASLIDNILRPLLISSGHPNLNPVLSFFALIGSLFIFGFAGLFIGPFVLVFASTILKKIL